MKTVSDHFTASFFSAGGSPDGAFDHVLLGKIGDDLRHLYGEVSDGDMPRILLDMAKTIDARRVGERHDD